MTLRANPLKPKKPKAKKSKRPSLPSVIRKADEITSRYIRTKYADENGNVKCVSCDTVLPWKEMHCAHFIVRGKKMTRWLEENLHPACCSCNSFRKEHHMREYTLFMTDFYGREFVDELRAMENTACSPSQVRQMAEDAIRDYSQGASNAN